MAPKLNSDAAKHNGSNGKAAASNSATPNPYAPSVPIPVYRELAAELQATKAMLESLNAQNQALARQNALLKKEVQTIVQSAVNLQSLMAPVAPVQPSDVAPPGMQVAAIAPNLVSAPPEPRKAKAPKSPEAARPGVAPVHEPINPQPNQVKSSPASSEAPSIQFANLPPIENPETLFTGQQESARPSDKPTRQMGGLWLVLVVLAIMVTAFTAGFLVMRPLLLKNSQ